MILYRSVCYNQHPSLVPTLLQFSIKMFIILLHLVRSWIFLHQSWRQLDLWSLHIWNVCLSTNQPLTIHKTLATGIIVPDWQNVIVTLIHTKGSKHNSTNDRPVSFTSTARKIMDRSLLQLNQNNLHNDA